MALKLISNEELGVVLFSYNIIVFLIPISGFGLNQGLLRYGALFKEKEDVPKFDTKLPEVKITAATAEKVIKKQSIVTINLV